MTTTPDPSKKPAREAAALRERLSRLSAASLRINESMELDTVLQDVLDSARALVGARYGMLHVLDDAGSLEMMLASGVAGNEFTGLWNIPGWEEVYRYLGGLPGPLRVADFDAHIRSLGLPAFLPPAPVRAFLAVPILRLGRIMGHLYLSHSDPGEAFSAGDEEILAMFASQAALVIANDRRHREERRARNRLETLVNTSPVGTVVFDAGTGRPISFNREALRIVERLNRPGQSPETLLKRPHHPAGRRPGGGPGGSAPGPADGRRRNRARRRNDAPGPRRAQRRRPHQRLPHPRRRKRAR